MRTAFYRHADSLVADWIVLRRTTDGNVHIHSNTLNTDLTIPEQNLIAADRDMTSPMFLSPNEPEHGVPGSLAAGGVRLPAASSPAPTSSVSAGAHPSHSSPGGMGGQPRARLSDIETAHLAAARAAGNAASNRLIVLLAHRDAGPRGLTGDELAAVTQMPYSAIGPRRPSLVDDGLIAPTKDRRPSDRGVMQQVFAITEAGRITAERIVA